MRPSPIQLLLSAGLAAGMLNATPDTAGLEFFETEIRPLLAEHCAECHSAQAGTPEANLSLDSRAGWQTGGDSGPAIIPGKPDASLLIKAVTHAGDLKMPPKTRLTDQEVAVLREWIAMGAPDPRDGRAMQVRPEIDLEKGREFWSFRPPVAHPIPEVTNTSWPANAIDRFILSRLEAENVMPAPDASKRDLLRRVYYDLIGLPPFPVEIDAFLANGSPTAFETVVDELLARPEFGERWGRHWLDVARFAESSGGGRSLVFPDAWRFRDYVIDAFNQDKPYDVFEVFDAANPNLVVGKRPSTNLPTQALFLMNSPFIREQSEHAATRLLENNAIAADAYELILGRLPTTAERDAAASFLATFEPADQQEAWSQLCQSLFACLDFRFLK